MDTVGRKYFPGYPDMHDNYQVKGFDTHIKYDEDKGIEMNADYVGLI